MYAIMALSIILANVNHSSGAQDLLVQYMAEWRTSLAIVTEPYYVPENSKWWGSIGNPPRVAITWGGGDVGDNLPCNLIERTNNWIAIDWGGYLVVGCYCPPRKKVNFRGFLSSVSMIIDPNMRRPILMLGDFNARSLQWDRKSTTRGEMLADWAAGRGLTLLNKDKTPTCVRTQGRSTVDLVWANPAMLRKIQNCYVDQENPTASDHLYVDRKSVV